MRTQNVTVAKLRREYWDRIQQGGKRFEIRNEPISDMSTMIVFEDADTGAHLGNARVLERHRFGPDATPWSWALLAQLGDTTVDELGATQPHRTGATGPLVGVEPRTARAIPQVGACRTGRPPLRMRA